MQGSQCNVSGIWNAFGYDCFGGLKLALTPKPYVMGINFQRRQGFFWITGTISVSRAMYLGKGDFTEYNGNLAGLAFPRLLA